MPHYKPYSPEWNRRRYLQEALDSYINDDVDNDDILADILGILSDRSESAYAEFQKVDALKEILGSK
tara:strand:- start:684 stop:884 length:201 start_codon:yes stop_codon:yes gene_type:complete